jgi:hypothetical protein
VRKALLALLIAALVVPLIATTVAAEPKPTNVPHQVGPGEAGFTAAFGDASFSDLWEELDGVGIEMPQTGGRPPPAAPSADVTTLGRPVGADDLVRGPVPIGFTFHYMNGPVEPAPGWPPAEGGYWYTGETVPPLPWNWPVTLTDWGYTEAYVATNGFVVLRDRSFLDERHTVSANCYFQDCEQPDMGAWNWYPWQLPIAEAPNNFIAPYWTDWAIGDNSYFKMAKGCSDLDGTLNGGIIGLPGNGDVRPICRRQVVTRPRGRMLYATLGTAPNRKFVVEWLNARNHWTGFLATFELQLFEGSNAILFLYKDFQPKDEGQQYFDVPSVVIGMEDWFGTTGVGQAYVLDTGQLLWLPADLRGHLVSNPKAFLDANPESLGGMPHLTPPMANGDMLGFVY